MKYLITLCAFMFSVQVMAATSCTTKDPTGCDQKGCDAIGFKYTVNGPSGTCIDAKIGQASEESCISQVGASRTLSEKSGTATGTQPAGGANAVTK